MTAIIIKLKIRIPKTAILSRLNCRQAVSIKLLDLGE